MDNDTILFFRLYAILVLVFMFLFVSFSDLIDINKHIINYHIDLLKTKIEKTIEKIKNFIHFN